MNKIARLVAPLALVASMIAPSLANAATMPTAAPISTQAASTVAKPGTDASAKWGHDDRDERRGDRDREMPRYGYGQRFEHGREGRRFDRGERFEHGRREREYGRR